jgi:hypothetical protein
MVAVGGDVRMLSISEAIKMVHDLGVKRFLRNNAIHAVKDLMPPSMRKRHEILYADSAMGIWIFIGILYLRSASLMGLAFFLLGCLIFPKFPYLARIGPYGVTVQSAIILICVFHDLSVNMKGMMAGAGAVGSTLGTWACARWLKKKPLGLGVN